MLNCTKCILHKTRKNVVPGAGNKSSNIMIIGECPGPEEDKAGKPFVGKAGKLLNKVLDSIGVDRERLFITNIVKCFPFHSLNPSPEHIQKCAPYLHKQIEEINPKLIVSLGRHSSQYFLGRLSITRESGKIRPLKSIHILPIVHPSYVLRGNMSVGDYAIDFIPMLGFYK